MEIIPQFGIFFVTSFKTPAVGHCDKTMSWMTIHLMPGTILMLTSERSLNAKNALLQF